jgi:hypothetical protein
MERALLWFKCAAVHDPVRPVLKRPAAIGWEAKFRQVDLIIERPPLGADLVVETESEAALTALAEKLAATFGEEMGLERLAKKKLA